ncbi:TonB-dependent receptor [Mucilaginibacter sp. JRF]|uniref:TonB-dependent receptor n=1 Tax=Mucilaginibacter sp. JRF TaxID=2780088 RepID=UPI001880A450|nr:TonB-dependent receptor [Mucilaginibacter sp. JRF]MBE9583159.1 TonB-dependent receptor [Mucilaginibacter sp. JRF]
MRISTLFTTIILSTCSVLNAANVKAQRLENVKLTINFNSHLLADGIDLLQKRSGLNFAYNKDLLMNIRVKNYSFKNTPLNTILDKLLQGTDYSYHVVNHNITIGYDGRKHDQNAAPGRISGKITDAKTGEVLPGVTVLASNNVSISSDLQGNYSLSLQPGTYSVEFRYMGYQAKKITGVEVKENDVTLLNIALNAASNELQMVTVTSSFRRESQSSLYALQRNNTAITDGISADLIRRTPDRNAGDAIKRITGVSILEGKYVVVRGLADRYNYTMLNGGVLPSTEPDRRTFSLDLIPAQAIESVIVTKTATADLPGEFAGGVVQVNTKDFPDQDFISVAMGSGVYAGQTGKPFFKDHNGGSDWLGHDDGGRALPRELNRSYAEFNKLYPEERFRISNALSKGWAPVGAGNARPIQQLQLGYGKTFNFTDSKLGIVALANYRHDETIDQVERYDLARLRRFSGTAAPGDSLAYLRSFPYERGYRYLVNAGALLNVAYQFGKNKVSIKSMFNRDFETITTLRTGERTQGNDFSDIAPTMVTDMHPTQKTLLGTQLQGEHKLGLTEPVTLTWNIAYNKVKKYEPNQTRLGYVNLYPIDTARYRDQNYFVPEFGSIQSSSRLFTDLKEDAYNVNFAVATPFKVKDQPQLFKAGAFTQFRKREYFTRNLGYFDAARGVNTDNDQGFPSPTPINLNQPIDKILSPENFRPGGLVVVNYELPANEYTGGANLASAFANMESNVLDNLKLIYGARIEFYTMSLSTSKELSTRLPGSGGSGVDQNPVDYIRYNTDVLPSASLIYSPLKTVNIRGAYSKTLTRPEFREISPYEYFDFVTGYITRGNPDLNRGTIQNLDFRAEWFPSAGEIFSASLFRKRLKDPVETTTQATTSTSGFIRTYTNIEGATNWGFEFEMRKNLYFGTGPEWLKNLVVFGNYSRIHSKITGNVQGLEDRPDVDQKLKERPLMGQSPYLLNAGILVNALKNTFTFSAAFNRSGRRIVIVGTTAEDRSDISTYPDIYENPRNQLDLQIGQKFMKQQFEVRFNAANVLNSPFINYQDFDLNGKYSGNVYDATVYSRRSFANYTLTLTYTFKK